MVGHLKLIKSVAEQTIGSFYTQLHSMWCGRFTPGTQGVRHDSGPSMVSDPRGLKFLRRDCARGNRWSVEIVDGRGHGTYDKAEGSY